MKLKDFNLFDTSPNSCSNQGDKMSLDREGVVGMGVLDKNILIEILTPLIDHPGMITWLDERIADELLERGLFCLIQAQVTPLGRDFLTQNKIHN